MNKAKRENYYEAKRALEQILAPLMSNEREELQFQKVIERLEREIKQSVDRVYGSLPLVS